MTTEDNKAPTLRKLLGTKMTRGDIGVELEVEFPRALDEPLPYDPFKMWTVKTDGSLRMAGYEYVTVGAVKLNSEFKKSFDELVQFIRLNRADPASPRTSCHVHLNMKERTPTQIWNNIVLYWLLEPAMLEYCGKARKGSLYCLQLQHAEQLALDAARSIERNDLFQGFSEDGYKYSSQNLAALRSYGSLEYRGMRGTTDFEVLWTWVTGLQEMSQFANLAPNPEELFDKYMDTPDYITTVFGEGSALGRELLRLPDLDELLSTNVSVLGELVYSADWKKFERDLGRRQQEQRLYDEEIDALIRPQVRPRRPVMWGDDLQLNPIPPIADVENP